MAQPPKPDWDKFVSQNTMFWDTEKQAWLGHWSDTYAVTPGTRQLYHWATGKEYEDKGLRWVNENWEVNPLVQQELFSVPDDV